MFHPASDDMTLGYLCENSSDKHKITKYRKWPATNQNPVNMSLRGTIKTKKLPPLAKTFSGH